MHDRTDLHWHRDKHGFALHVGQARQPAVRVIPDPIHASLYRVWYRDGSRSDVTNLTRACDAAAGFVLADLRPSEGGNCRVAAPPMRFPRRGAVGYSPRLRALRHGSVS